MFLSGRPSHISHNLQALYMLEKPIHLFVLSVCFIANWKFNTAGVFKFKRFYTKLAIALFVLYFWKLILYWIFFLLYCIRQLHAMMYLLCSLWIHKVQLDTHTPICYAFQNWKIICTFVKQKCIRDTHDPF